MRRWGNGLVIVVCVAVAILPLVPPATDSDGFSLSGAMEHISAIASVPHPLGSAENAWVRSYLIETLIERGLSPETQTVEVTDYFGAPGNAVEAVNVAARIEGTGGGRAVALVAHYDTVPWTPGANDNSASVAILLEVATALRADEPSRNDVIFLFTDGEEPAPRFGSRAFVDAHPWFADVSFVMNLEASGSSGGSTIAEASGPTEWLISHVATSAPYPLAFSFFTEIAGLIGGFGTDFDPFREAGVPGLAFAYLHGSPVYHTDRDSIENVGLRSVQQQGANTLALTRSLVDADLDPPSDASDSVFLSVGRWSVLRYPTAWSAPIALAALIVFGVAVLRGPRPTRLLKGVAIALGAFLAAAVSGALVWMLITMISTAPGIGESYVYLGALLAGAGGVWWLLARRMDADTGFSGVVGVWVLLGLATSLLVPGVSYLFSLPALVGSSALLARRFASAWTVAVVSLVSLAVTVPIIDFLFQMAQPRPGNPDSELTPVAGAATAIAVLVIGLIHSVWRASETPRVDQPRATTALSGQ